jgi:tRNA pseudouridine32 synthase/23S rRNA pseudouridine746 synthase
MARAGSCSARSTGAELRGFEDGTPQGAVLASRTPAITPLYEDETLLAFDKPAGLLAVPGRGDDKQDCLWQRVRERWPDALVVHRLDMATSGLMLFARGAAVQRRLSMDFAARRIAKHYIALVHGRLAEEHGRIDLPLAADWPRRPLQKVDFAEGKPSITDWQLLSFDAGQQTSRLALRPLSGRTHQLRVHLAAIGRPIVGDALYAPPELHGERLMLHAETLRLAHPIDGHELQLRCEPPF